MISAEFTAGLHTLGILHVPTLPYSPHVYVAAQFMFCSFTVDRVSPCGAHGLRHACARHLLRKGFSIKQIGDQLGHRRAASTSLYAQVDLDGLREVAELSLRGLI